MACYFTALTTLGFIALGFIALSFIAPSFFVLGFFVFAFIALGDRALCGYLFQDGFQSALFGLSGRIVSNTSFYFPHA